MGAVTSLLDASRNDPLLAGVVADSAFASLPSLCTDLVGSDELALAKCGHVFHHECIGSFVEEVTARKQKPTCPTCHKHLTVTMQLQPHRGPQKLQ